MNELSTKEKKKTGKIVNAIYWFFMFLWTLACIGVLAVVLDYFYCFLTDYQKVYEETRPKLAMDEIFTKFDEADVDWILENVDPIPFSELEEEETVRKYVLEYIQGKKVSYTTKAGEHIEERPVYVVTVAGEPFAVVRLEKKEETAEYGHPLWQLREVEIFVEPTINRSVVAPENASVYVNGILLSEDYVIETVKKNEHSAYYAEFSELVSLPGYKTYEMKDLFEEPEVYIENMLGEPMEVVFDEKEKTYRTDFGGSEAIQKEVRDYTIQFLKDYALHVTNDLKAWELDKYFTADSALLKGIKEYPPQWYDDHMPPEFKNEEVKEFILYTENAFSTRVYLEQYIYVPFSNRIEMLVTDMNVFYVKVDGEWKVSGIAFESSTQKE